MEDMKPGGFPTEVTERGVITVKLEQVNVDADTVYCSNEQDTVGEDPLALNETYSGVDIDTTLDLSGVSIGFAKTEFIPESEESLESVPVLERDVKVTTGNSVASRDDTGPPTLKKSKKLEQIRPSICTKCHVGFPNTDLLRHHQSTAHQDERRYSCRHCGKAFQSISNCRRHESIHNPKRWQGEPQFQCDLCSKSYHLKYSLDLHRKKIHFGYKPKERPKTAPLKQHHSKGTRNPNAYRKPKQEHPCPHCDLKFLVRYELKRHMSCHTKERPFSCHICQQPFLQLSQVKSHIRNVHENATPTGTHHPAPRWKAGQPCPCTVCGKVFPVASQLRAHQRLHTGELPFACDICGKRFRVRQTLSYHIKLHHTPDLMSNPMKLYKCLICGQDNFIVFNALRRHRRKCHAKIPNESEKEKPFACGVCGKPHYLREDAIICARLKHDPSSLLKAMFKFKCSECPQEMLGFRNLTVLRKHWADAHGDKTLPTKLRIGMYVPNLKADELPRCKVDKKKVQIWKSDGIPPEVVKSEIPLFIELPLLPIPEEMRFKQKEKKSGGKRKVLIPRLPKLFQCDLCGVKFSSSGNLTRHKKNVHNPLKKNMAISNRTHFQSKRKVGRPGQKRAVVDRASKKGPKNWKCDLCGVRVTCLGNLNRHKKNVHGEPGGPNPRIPPEDVKRGTPLNVELPLTPEPEMQCFRLNSFLNKNKTRKVVNRVSSKGPKNWECDLCGARVTCLGNLNRHKKNVHGGSDPNPRKTVNIHDAQEVTKILNYKHARVSLLKWKFPQGMLDKCKRA